jgi:hypothetical protein
MLAGGKERSGKRNVCWRNSVDWRVEYWLEEQSELESGMLTGRTERTEEWNIGWKNGADWRAECLLEEQIVLESGMSSGGTEWTGEKNVAGILHLPLVNIANINPVQYQTLPEILNCHHRSRCNIQRSASSVQYHGSLLLIATNISYVIVVWFLLVTLGE